MAPRKIHIASKTYQRNWAINNKTFCTKVGEIEGARRDIDQVGYRPRWWGADRELAQAVEQTLSGIEGKATRFLRDPTAYWLPDEDLRAFMSVFIAVHIVRSPAWRVWHEGQIYGRVAAEIRRDPSSEAVQMEVAHRLSSDRERVSSVITQATKLASLLASMHWSLLSFDDRLLALSDQPVCAVPLAVETGSAPMQAMPDTGFADLLEVRVPISPSFALILSWHDHPEANTIHAGTFDHACSLNASTISQADKHWMRHPHGTGTRLRPQSLQAVADPISPQLLRGYDVAAVLRSRRRQEAIAMVNKMIEDRAVDLVGWVSLQHDVPAAA